MYSKHPNIPYQTKIRKDTQIDDTQRSIQKQQQCINISNNKYGRSLLRQDNSYDNDSIKMINKTTTMYHHPPPYQMVGGHHPYPTHQYHHPYHNMSHMPSNPIYPQPATATANDDTANNNNQTAKLQYHPADATTSKQEAEPITASMTHHMSQYHVPPPSTYHAYPYPYSYMPHNAQASAAAYHRHQYVNSKVSDDQMASVPIKHDGRKRKSILPPPPNEQSQYQYLTSRVSDGDISEKTVPTKKYRVSSYSRQVTADDTHQSSQAIAPTATTWPQINNASTNVIVLPAPKRYTRKKRYCIHEGCKLKQKKGEYCFKHSMAIVHDGSVPEYLIPPTPTAVVETSQEVLPIHKAVVHSVDTVSAVLSIAAAKTQQIQVQPTRTQRDTPSGILGETPQEVPPIHKAVVHSVDAVSTVLSIAAVTQQIQVQPTLAQRDTQPSAVNDTCDMPELLRHESRSSVNQLKEILADHPQEGVTTSAAVVLKEKQPQVQLTHPSAISVAKTPRVIQPTPLRIQKDTHLSAVKDMYDMPELLRHQSKSSVSSKLMAREILGIDSSERSARSTTTKTHPNPKHVEIANISQIESLGSEDDQLVAFMNEVRDDLEDKRGDDGHIHILS